jgi:hypothetical protein
MAGLDLLTDRLLKALRASAFLSIAIVVLAAGCDRPRSTPEDATGASIEELPRLIGKQVTIRGKFSLDGKFGPYVSLGDQRAVYLVPRGSFTWGEPYSEMEGKLVAATGTLRFYHSPDTEPAQPAVARAPDYFYLEAETAQLRLISP